MVRLTTGICLLILGGLMFIAACNSPAPSAALEEHLRANPDIRKKYVYQSVIRLANTDANPDFNKLIRDVRKVTVYLPPRKDSTYSIQALRPAFREEGFETLLEVRTTEGQRISLWTREWRGQDYYLGLLEADDADMILEIDGEPAIEYLPSITGANQSSILNLLKGEL